MNITDQLTNRFLFFTGKGGVGKTSSAAALAVELADQDDRVLLVSTDPASNLDTVLGTELGPDPRSVQGVDGLDALNIDPQKAAREYRENIIEPYRGVLPDESIESMEEQLSGSCTVEIAAFDKFSGLLDVDGLSAEYDRVVFDTAPTGHTLRLLQLPAAWTEFIDTNERGASCLGPVAGLEEQQERYETALEALSDSDLTTLVLVSRPEPTALEEVERTRLELADQGVTNQFLILNGVFEAGDSDDELAQGLERKGRRALQEMPGDLAELPSREVPLKPNNVVGLEALRSFFDDELTIDDEADVSSNEEFSVDVHQLSRVADDLVESDQGLVMMMGKGGVGKTTMAAALAVAVADRGASVHLTTTDPAAHLTSALDEEIDNLRVTRIDPEEETEKYRQKVLERSKDELDEEGLELLKEDLRSPCTEEIAVFQAFSRTIREASKRFVVTDTAPPGHTLLLLDATGSYHRETLRHAGEGAARMTTPMMRLQDPEQTKILVVTLPETTPVLEAARLHEDLGRAGITPFGWVINSSLAAAGTTHPLLAARAATEAPEIARVRDAPASRYAVVPMRAEAPVGPARLRALCGAEAAPA